MANNIDINRDGVVTKTEIHNAGEILEIELREEKADTQRRMAWAAMISMAIFTVILFSPMISDSRVQALADLLGLFYIAQAGIVGAYMGVTAWMSHPRQSSYDFSSYGGYGSRFVRRRVDDDRDDKKKPADNKDDIVIGRE